MAASGSATTCTAANATRLRIGPAGAETGAFPLSVYGVTVPSARGNRSVRLIRRLLFATIASGSASLLTHYLASTRVDSGRRALVSLAHFPPPLRRRLRMASKASDKNRTKFPLDE